MADLFGKLLVLYGPASSGKTTVASALAKAAYFGNAYFRDDYTPSPEEQPIDLKKRAQAGAAVIVVVNAPTRDAVPVALLKLADIELTTIAPA